MMTEVEDKYRRDIRNAGGYDEFLQTLINRDVKNEFADNHEVASSFYVQVELKDLSIPSMPCDSVLITRSFDIEKGTEELEVLIDGAENELTKEVGYEVFVNDFILPREIAKFFFFDAEKIVSLAEAKSVAELKNLSKAYSEVLGIKKYEDLKKDLETLLVRMRRNSVKPEQEENLNKLLSKESEINQLIEISKNEKILLQEQINSLTKQSDDLHERLIREGNGITAEELHALKKEHLNLKSASEEIKENFRKNLELVPIVLAGKRLDELDTRLQHDSLYENYPKLNFSFNNDIYNSLLQKLRLLNIGNGEGEKVLETIEETFNAFKMEEENVPLGFSREQIKEIRDVLNAIRDGFSTAFQNTVKAERNNRLATTRIIQKIKQAEARKTNAVAEKLREEKLKIDEKIIALAKEMGKTEEELNSLEIRLAGNHKILSEYEKNFLIINEDAAKSEVTQKLLNKITLIIKRIKEDKKYSLQKSILLGLKKLMHKHNFISNVQVNVQDEVIDIDLLDANNRIIDKESLSKGEQQLYATALLKALVDESGIKFPVFIDSPLQKFDKFHSENIIKEFYPAVSEQVVLFPLLEKELSETEYQHLHPYLNNVFMIQNGGSGSTVRHLRKEQLFTEFKTSDAHVHSN